MPIFEQRRTKPPTNTSSPRATLYRRLSHFRRGRRRFFFHICAPHRALFVQKKTHNKHTHTQRHPLKPNLRLCCGCDGKIQWNLCFLFEAKEIYCDTKCVAMRGATQHGIYMVVRGVVCVYTIEKFIIRSRMFVHKRNFILKLILI